MSNLKQDLFKAVQIVHDNEREFLKFMAISTNYSLQDFFMSGSKCVAMIDQHDEYGVVNHYLDTGDVMYFVNNKLTQESNNEQI